MMKVLAKEKSKVLAEAKGWSLERAEGYVEGERFRRRGLRPSSYLRVGIDEYCRGFRESYYDRQAIAVKKEDPVRFTRAQ
jgi:hypothetical protein